MTTYSMTLGDLQNRIKRGDYGNNVFLSQPHCDTEYHLMTTTNGKEHVLGWYDSETQTLEI